MQVFQRKSFIAVFKTVKFPNNQNHILQFKNFKDDNFKYY